MNYYSNKKIIFQKICFHTAIYSIRLALNANKPGQIYKRLKKTYVYPFNLKLVLCSDDLYHCQLK